MGDIASYLSLAISLAVGVGIIASLASEEFSEQVGGAARLICTAVLIVPIISAVTSAPELLIPELEPPASELAWGYGEVSREAFCDGISLAVADRIDARAELVCVFADGFIFEEMRAEELTVTLTDVAALSDVRGLSQWLEENFVTDGGVCKVVIAIE